MCDAWREDFCAFLRYMGLRPEGCSLDRIDSNGNYEPGNCRWATRSQQDRNKRNNRYLEFEGKRMVLADWAAELGIDKGALGRKLRSGLTLERLFAQESTLPMAA